MFSSLGRSISFGPFTLYPVGRVVERDGARLAMGSRALDILIVLTERAGELVSHKELTQRVWRSLVVTPGSLRVHVAGLRKALGDGEGKVQYIANVPGQGYCFVAPIRRFDPDELGVSAAEAAERSTPESDATLAAQEQALRSDVGSAARAPDPQPPRRRHNLPNQLTSFIGREKEIRELKGLLSSTRLLTLTGAGGCGKTRLAIQLAAEVLDDFPDGCWLVELAPLGDPMLVVQTVANVLDIKAQGDASLAELISERLATRRLLLALDNAEHLLEPCASLADLLLRRCSGLKLVVTSRESLGLNGELTYRVPSLSIPDAEAATTEAVLACEAARLFVERARLHRADFEVTPKNARALTSICRRLDGIALAIELAAPRTRTMSIDELDRNLDNRFEILTGGHRTALPRHRTLRSLIDWSYDLLDLAERTMLRRASVFAGGFTVDAAECVCADDIVQFESVFDLLTALTDKNLLVADTRQEPTRFGMLESVRHYARDRLRESGEDELILSRHVAYFLALAERLDEIGIDTERKALLSRLDAEHDNVRAALAWCEATAAQSITGLRLAGRLDWFWRIRGHFSEGRGWIARLLASTHAAESTEDHAVALHAAGILAYHERDYSAAEALYREALSIFRRLGHRPRIARTLGNLGNLAQHQDQFVVARQLFEEALTIAREIGDRRSIWLGLQCLANLALDTGDLTSAEQLFEEALPIARELGDWSTAVIFGSLGALRQLQDDPSGAREALMEALDAERQFGNKAGIVITLTALGEVSHDLGDLAAAKALLKEAWTIEQAVNDRKAMAATLEALAGLSTALADPYRAARLFGRAERFREELGGDTISTVPPSQRSRRQRHVAAARRAAQNDAEFDRAWTEGRSMTLAEAVQSLDN
jgi:predicted ATPase/DNA-binding winged helix-turn-helix (wHTH) protein